MERDELMKVTATRYAAAQLALEQADRDAHRARTNADNARIERDRIERELKKFVGRNVPRRVIAIPNSTKAVLVQMDLSKEDAVYVSLEALD